MAFKMVREFDGYKNVFLVSSVTRTEDGDVFRRSKWLTLTGILNDFEGLHLARTEYLNVDKDVTELKIVSDDLVYDSCIDIDTKKVEYLVKQWLIDLNITFVDDKGVVHDVELIKGDDGVMKHELKSINKKSESYDSVTFYVVHLLDEPVDGIFTISNKNTLKLTNYKKLLSAFKKLNASRVLPEIEYTKNGKPRNMTQKKKTEIKNAVEKYNNELNNVKKLSAEIGVVIPDNIKSVVNGEIEVTLPILSIEFATYVDKEGFECVCDS